MVSDLFEVTMGWGKFKGWHRGCRIVNRINTSMLWFVYVSFSPFILKRQKEAKTAFSGLILSKQVFVAKIQDVQASIEKIA